MTLQNLNEQIESLIHAWCDRREYSALAALLSPWISNNGLTDGWEDLATALRHVSNFHHLPASEREKLKLLWVELDVVLRSR
jgi:hypothetical protein